MCRLALTWHMGKRMNRSVNPQLQGSRPVAAALEVQCVSIVTLQTVQLRVKIPLQPCNVYLNRIQTVHNWRQLRVTFYIRCDYYVRYVVAQRGLGCFRNAGQA